VTNNILNKSTTLMITIKSCYGMVYFEGIELHSRGHCFN